MVTLDYRHTVDNLSFTLVENDRLMTFDNIVANPPFFLDKWGAVRQKMAERLKEVGV